MSSAGNLLRSNRGLDLPPESLHTLLKAYERSVTLTTSTHDDRFEYVNSLESTILAAPPTCGPVSSLTYEWYIQLRSRNSLIDFLITHEITGMQDSTNGWPCLGMSIGEAFEREQEFKRRGLHLLFQIADCTAGITDTPHVRKKQAQTLEWLTAVQLATLGCLVEVVGQGFFTITRAALLGQLSLNRAKRGLSTHPQPTPTGHTPSTLAVPPQIPWDDLTTDNWLRECMCVFEDRLQRFGPYFAWAYVAGHQNRKRRPDLWASQELQEGLDNMNAFELGYTMSYASLQSVVWKVFCRKAGCSLAESWNVAKGMVEVEMEAY
ncbi:hypothetical protein BGZ60DRAFT_433103 [Tricladium varicosporioides]|nr:hypothetical protein BGZ60DRAFT_433103 [Hymenoscyphus varicosporioides]